MEHMTTKNNEGQRSNSPNSEGSCGCILVVTSQANPAQHVMDYVISVADRLGSKIIMASVNPRPLLRENSFLSRTPRVAVSPEADVFRAKAQSRGIAYQCIADSGKIDKVISRLCHIVKRVEFVVIDQGIRLEEVAAGSPVPVFSVAGGTQGSAWKTRGHQIRTLFHGETTMKATTRKTYLMKTLIFGAMTAALYGAVFAYQEAIMHYWTKGGIYCLLPVATVFVFSYAHGSFTSYFWSALGIEGSKASSTQQKEKHVSTTETAKKRPDTRPRVQANAS
jgi:hypothetical protein